MSRAVSYTLIVVTLFAAIYIAPLGIRPMVAPDEFRYAEIPRAMLAHNDWVTPRLDGLLYFEKPVFGYWLNAVSIRAFGENPFGVRLPSAVAAGLSALFVLLILRRDKAGWEISLLAAVILLTSLQFFGTGIFAVLDGPFTALITGTMACFFAAYNSSIVTRRRTLMISAGVLCGCAFMTKGFVAFVIPVLSILPFLVFEKRTTEVFKLVWIPAVASVVISLPWAILIFVRSPDFWTFFVWTAHVQRFLSPGWGQHPEPTWFFLPVLAIGVMPWTTMIPAALSGLRANTANSSLMIFSSCWFTSTILFFSISSGKLAAYILPAFPPFAILAAIGLTTYLQSGRRTLWTLGALASASLPLVSAVALNDHRFELYDSANQWRAALLTTALVAWALFAIAAVWATTKRSSIITFATQPVLLLLALHIALPTTILDGDTPGAFLGRHAFRASPNTVVVSDMGAIYEVCWSFKRDDVLILGKPGELSFGIEKDISKYRHMTRESFGEFLEEGSAENILLVVQTKTYDEVADIIPAPVYEDRDIGLVVTQLNLGDSPASYPAPTISTFDSVDLDGGWNNTWLNILGYSFPHEEFAR